MKFSTAQRGDHELRLSPVQQAWLNAHPDAAEAALRSLINEPLSRFHANQLRRLITSLRDERPPEAAESAAPAVDLASGETAANTGESSTSAFALGNGTDAAPPKASLSGLLLTVTEPSRQRLSLRLLASILYPLFVLGLTGLVVAGIAVFLVPTFERMFDDFGLTLPAPTLLLVIVSRMVRFTYWLWVPLLFFSIVLLYFASQFLGGLLDRLGMRRRGSIRKLIGMARLCRGMVDQVQAGRSTPQALRLASVDLGDAHLERAANELAAALERRPAPAAQPRIAGVSSPFDTPETASFDAPLADAAMSFPANVMVALVGDHGAASQANLPLLNALADVYDERASGRTETGSTLFAMVAVVVVGAFVLFTLLALFLPLVELITGLT